MPTIKFTSAVALNRHGTVLKKSGTRQWTVAQPFEWYLTYLTLSNGKKWRYDRITVGWGFETDFGSIPRVFWIFFNPTKWVAYILHDYLYEMRWVYIDEFGKIKRVSRREADRILREALIVEARESLGEINTLTKKLKMAYFVTSAWMQWLAVRWFGWMAWYNVTL